MIRMFSRVLAMVVFENNVSINNGIIKKYYYKTYKAITGMRREVACIIIKPRVP